MVEPHSTSQKPPKHNVRTWRKEGSAGENLRVGVRLAAVLKCQPGLHPGDEAVRARRPGDDLLEILHAVGLAHRGRSEGPVADLDALGLVFGKEVRFQGRDVGICVGVW